MALINPFYTFMVPFLFFVTAPLAILAGITTTLAFSALILRVAVVYLDIALSLLPSHATSRGKQRYTRQLRHHKPRAHINALGTVLPAATSSSLPGDDYFSPLNTAHQYHQHHQHQHPLSGIRRSPSSAASVVSAGSTTSVGGIDAGLGLMPSIGADRDFEGIGGWRSGKEGDDDDDAAWTSINSRFQLPYTRGHHSRDPSTSGWPAAPGEGAALTVESRRRGSSESRQRGMAPTTPPNSSRVRTPPASRTGVIAAASSDGYFPLTMSPSASRK